LVHIFLIKNFNQTVRYNWKKTRYSIKIKFLWNTRANNKRAIFLVSSRSWNCYDLDRVISIIVSQSIINVYFRNSSKREESAGLSANDVNARSINARTWRRRIWICRNASCVMHLYVCVILQLRETPSLLDKWEQLR